MLDILSVCVCVHRTFSPRSRKWFKPFVRGTVRTEKQSPALFTARNGVMARLYSRKVAQNFCFETETSLNTRISRLCSESLAKTQHVCSTSNFTYLLLLLTFELIRSTIWKNNRSALCNCKCEGPTLSSAGGGLQPFYAFKCCLSLIHAINAQCPQPICSFVCPPPCGPTAGTQ